MIESDWSRSKKNMAHGLTLSNHEIGGSLPSFMLDCNGGKCRRFARKFVALESRMTVSGLP
ncbi:MAG: hypothetical protein CMK54_03835 [Proteobacteria bacterium]|nr:hypothetical protein [Pseudomonadota bacterium]